MGGRSEALPKAELIVTAHHLDEQRRQHTPMLAGPDSAAQPNCRRHDSHAPPWPLGARSGPPDRGSERTPAKASCRSRPMVRAPLRTYVP